MRMIKTLKYLTIAILSFCALSGVVGCTAFKPDVFAFLKEQKADVRDPDFHGLYTDRELQAMNKQHPAIAKLYLFKDPPPTILNLLKDHLRPPDWIIASQDPATVVFQSKKHQATCVFQIGDPSGFLKAPPPKGVTCFVGTIELANPK